MRSNRRASRGWQAACTRRAVVLAALAFGLLAGAPAVASGPVVGWGLGSLPINNATAIAAGEYYSCAIQDGSGAVVCWGLNSTGQATPPPSVNGTLGKAEAVAAGSEHTLAIRVPECSDGLDNDGDGHFDFSSDAKCDSPVDVSEHEVCRDGLDNDGDGRIDFDGGAWLDADGDGFIDAAFHPATPPVTAPDAQCMDDPSKAELAASCGLGAELAPLLSLLAGLRRRRRTGPWAFWTAVLATTTATLTTAPGAMALALRIDASYTGSTAAESVGSLRPVPDVAGAVGPDHFVELLNGRYAVYAAQTGSLVESSPQVDFWTQAGVSDAIDEAADPHVLYDATSERWYAAAQTVAPDASSEDRLLVAVSKSSDPTVGWTGFALDADPTTNNWLDFPMLGLDAEGVYVAVSRLAAGTNNFLGTSVAVFPKADLVSPTPSVAGATVLTTTFDQTGFDPQPAVDLDGSGLPLPLLSGNLAGFGQLVASRLGGPVSAPSLAGGILIPVAPALGPPDAEQPGDKLPLETGGRNNVSLFSGSVVLRNGSLWAAQGIEVDGRAAIRWLEVDPANDIVLQSGVIANPAMDFYTASIAVNQLDQVVIGFTGSSESVFPSAYAAAGERVGSTTVFGEPLLLRAGVSDYEQLDGRGRNAWGDYSTTVVDPTDPSVFWTFQEFVFDTDVWAVSITKLAVPEPGTAALVGTGGLLGLALARRRRPLLGRRSS